MRIAHLSDPHLLSLDGTRLRDFLSKRWIGGLNLLASRAREHKLAVFDALVEDINGASIDHVLCTGDITNVALPSEFVFARARFDRFAHGPQAATVIPGNHDAYVQIGVPLFTEHFAEYCTSDPGWEWADGDGIWPIVRVRGDVAIVGLTTALRTPWFNAWGRVGDAQLERLEQVLGDERIADKFRIVAIHHPPVGRYAEHPRHGLRDHGRFAEVLARVGADLVLHGHEHLDLAAEAQGPDGAPIPVHGIQSATYAGGRSSQLAAYRIYTVDGAGVSPRQAPRETRVWNKATAEFESVSC